MSNEVAKSPLSKVSFSLHLVAHSMAAVGCGLVLLAVGQPIWTDDIWWHLALGESYLSQGPWLTHDPLLFTALGPPPPSSWLMDAGLRATWNLLGFGGLRIVHVGLVIAIMAIVWASLRRASRSLVFASVGTSMVAMLSAYRLVQLRPHLGTIAAAVFLHWILFSKPEIPSWKRVFAAAALMGVWANLHPAYPIGPALVAAASAALFLTSLLAGQGDGDGDGNGNAEDRGLVLRARATRLGWVFLFGIGATFINPSGVDGYVRAFSAGAGSESIAIVVDEWSRIQLLTWPTASLPPSRLHWVSAWFLIAAVPLAAARMAWARWQSDQSDGASDSSADPVMVVLAVTGLGAMLLATRFVWMAFWPVLLLASTSRSATRTRRLSLTLALVSIALVAGFYRWGDWPMVTRGLPSTLTDYRTPYAAGKYHAHAVSFMRATKLEGNLFGRYAEGGFQAFWLGPAIRTATNGSLNMSNEALTASFAIRERMGTRDNPAFVDALDELGVDLFLGTGLPMQTRPGRPPNYSTIHLEDTPGWILVFRNVDSALYLRNDTRNESNLEKVADYYLANGIPFDRALGFQTERVMRATPEWSRAQGIWTPLLGRRTDPGQGTRATGPMADAYLALGMYDEANRANAALLRIDPTEVSALRRHAWLLLRAGRRGPRDELVAAYRALSRHSISDDSTILTRELLVLLKAAIDGESIPAYRRQVIPVFTRPEAHRLLRSMHPAGPSLD
jgi:hypothetical protein